MIEIKYLITGTGRCGTVYMAKAFTKSGISCSHEAVFTEYGLDFAYDRLNGVRPIQLSHCSTSKFVNGHWEGVGSYIEDITSIQAESSYLAAPFLNHPLLEKATIIHLVRHPNDVINSFCNHLKYFAEPNPTNQYEEFIFTHLPELKARMTQYERGAMFYILWNQMIEKCGRRKFHRIEDPLQDLASVLNIPLLEIEDKKANTIKMSNAREFTLQDIPSTEIKNSLEKMVKEYGYNNAEQLAIRLRLLQAELKAKNQELQAKHQELQAKDQELQAMSEHLQMKDRLFHEAHTELDRCGRWLADLQQSHTWRWFARYTVGKNPLPLDVRPD
jgi:hypothetical protein